MRLRAMSVLGLFVLAGAGPCDSTAPDTCVQNRTYTIGTKVDEAMADGDCALDGNSTDLFKFSLSEQKTVKFVVTATGDANPKIAPNNVVVMRDGLGKTLTIFATLLAGNYTFGVSSGDGPEDGAYSVESSFVTAPAPIGCVTVFTGATTSHAWMMRGTQLSGVITADDCVNNGYLGDTQFIYMEAGKFHKITVVSSGTGGINVELNHDGSILAHQNTANNAPGTVTFNYQANVSMRVGINIIGIPAGAKPTYTVKFE
jgi:hypothetical protein